MDVEYLFSILCRELEDLGGDDAGVIGYVSRGSDRSGVTTNLLKFELMTRVTKLIDIMKIAEGSVRVPE